VVAHPGDGYLEAVGDLGGGSVSTAPASSRNRLVRSEPRDQARAQRRPIKCADCERDSAGRIKRSAGATRAFKRENPCPATGKTTGACPGYQIDHRVPLSQGGAGETANMEWLTTQEHKEKTARERQ